MTNKTLIITGLLLFAAGIVLVLLSFSYERFSNEQEFHDKFMQIKPGKNISDEYLMLRDKYISPKYRLEDYGITSILLGFCTYCIGNFGIGRLRTARSKKVLIWVGIGAALLSHFGYIGDMFVELDRGSFPPWADSIGIPLIGVPLTILITLAWVFLNLIGVSRDFKFGENVCPLKFKKNESMVRINAHHRNIYNCMVCPGWIILVCNSKYLMGLFLPEFNAWFKTEQP